LVDHSYGPVDINKVGCMKVIDDTHSIAAGCVTVVFIAMMPVHVAE